jgi:MFS family permease
MRTFYGWRVVAAAFVLAAFGWGIGFYGPPVFLRAVCERTGWSVALVSSAVTMHFLIGALVGARLPALHRRLGIPATTKMAAVSIAAGILGWAMAIEIWQLFVAALLSGAGWSAISAAAVNAIVSPWFDRTRPAALAMAYNGGSIGGVVFSPLWVVAIDVVGFPLAAAMVGLAAILTLWALASSVLRQTPQQMGLMPDGDAPGSAAAYSSAQHSPTLSLRSDPGFQPGERLEGGGGARLPMVRDVPQLRCGAPHHEVKHELPGSYLWRDWKFLTLAGGMAVGLFAQIGLTAHLFSLLAPAVGAQKAGLMMGLATALAIAGRTCVGWLMPPDADRRSAACMSYAVQGAGSILFVLAGGTSIPLLLAGIALFGLGFGNSTSLPPLIAQREFANEDVARVVALIVAIAQAGYAFAPAAFGLIRTLESDAAPAAPDLFLAAALLQALAIAAFLAGRQRTARSPDGAQRNPGPTARHESTHGCDARRIPHCASLHTGYLCCMRRTLPSSFDSRLASRTSQSANCRTCGLPAAAGDRMRK